MELKFDWEFSHSPHGTYREAELLTVLLDVTVSQHKNMEDGDMDNLNWAEPRVHYPFSILPSTPEQIETWIEILTDVNTILHKWNGE